MCINKLPKCTNYDTWDINMFHSTLGAGIQLLTSLYVLRIKMHAVYTDAIIPFFQNSG